MSEFQDFVRKQFPVQAARVTPMNIEELAEACGGKIMHDGEKENNFSRDYIKVRVAFPLNEEQTKARIGDWLVKQGRTFKVYKDKPFRSTFENRDGTPVARDNQQKKGKGKPSPANMPKKRAEVPSPENTPSLPPERDDVQYAKPAENQVAEAVETVPAPAEESSIKDGSVFGESEPDREKNPGVVEQAEAIADDAEQRFIENEEAKEKQPITLDELNTHPGDPRTADDIHREGQQQG